MTRTYLRAISAMAALILATSITFAADTKTDKKVQSKAETAKPADSKTNSKPAEEKTVKGALVDINTATEAELKAIPGIGDAYATKIAAGRPYANKTQLKTRDILPVPSYEKVKDLIIARQPKKDDKAVPKADGKKK